VDEGGERPMVILAEDVEFGPHFQCLYQYSRSINVGTDGQKDTYLFCNVPGETFGLSGDRGVHVDPLRAHENNLDAGLETKEDLASVS
jgi:hypothetical protein